MTLYGYARLSVDEQMLDSQVEALKALGCEKVFREDVGGARADRPQLAKLLATVAKGDVLVVTRLDQLARSTRDLLDILDTLAVRGAAFRSLSDRWADTTTPHGRLLPTVLGGLAAFERGLLQTRTGAGRARAKARGTNMGRPSSLNPEQRRAAAEALDTGRTSQADLARQFNVNRSTISRLADKLSGSSLPVRPAIDADTERAARAFMRRLADKYPLVEGILYGSRARGTHTAESDADIAVVMNGEHGNRWEATRAMSGIAFDVMLETGIRIQALPLWQSELKRPETFSNPALIANIKREGLRL